MSKYWNDALVPKGHYSDHAFSMLNYPEYAYKHGIAETYARIVKLLMEDDKYMRDENGDCLLSASHPPECCNCMVIDLIKGAASER